MADIAILNQHTSRKILWANLLAFAKPYDLAKKENQNKILDYLKDHEISKEEHQNALISAISDKNLEVLTLLLILGIQANLDTFPYKGELVLLAHALSSNEIKLVKALEETGLYNFEHIKNVTCAHLIKKSREELSLLVKAFSLKVHDIDWMVVHLEKDEKTLLKELYERQLKPFINREPEDALTPEEVDSGLQAMNLYRSCLNPLEYYCKANLWDQKAQALHQSMYLDPILNMHCLERTIGSIIKTSPCIYHNAALLALIQCAINVAGVQKQTAESLKIHADNVQRIQAEIQKLKDKQASAHFKIKCAVAVGITLGASCIASVVCLSLLQNPVFLFPLLFSLVGGFILMVYSTSNVEKQPVSEQLKKLRFLNSPVSTKPSATSDDPHAALLDRTLFDPC